VAAGLGEIRERIIRKSREYFVFDRMDLEKRNMFHGAMDALLDAGMAAACYGRAFSADTGIDLLICYGFLQAIYIQQDAVVTLCESLELKWDPNENEQLKKIREARNRLTGHPSKAGKNRISRQRSFHIRIFLAVDSGDTFITFTAPTTST
jgi:hypothetical protein